MAASTIWSSKVSVAGPGWLVRRRSMSSENRRMMRQPLERLVPPLKSTDDRCRTARVRSTSVTQ
jgi:hypothetical protein